MEVIAEGWYIPVLIAAGSLACGAFNRWKKSRKK